jgi:hypothetical protein
MKNFIYLAIIFISVIIVVGCQNKSKEQKTDSLTKIEKQITKDSAITKTVSNEHSGIYEGKISVQISPDGYELVDGWIAFDFIGNQNIVLYDGVFYDNYKLENGEIKEVIVEKNNKKDLSSSNDEEKGFGKFGESKNKKGFFLEYLENESGEDNVKTVFLRKTGDVNTAKEKIKIYKEEKTMFENFYSEFKQGLLNKDFKKLGSYGNFPLVDESNKSKIINSDQLENRLRLAFDENFFKENYNLKDLNDLPGRFEDHYPRKEGVYMLQTSVLFISFKKIYESFKVVSISHPYN